MLRPYSKMPDLDEHEISIFCKTAKTIIKKGHLEISAILKFINSEDHKKDKKIIRLRS